MKIIDGKILDVNFDKLNSHPLINENLASAVVRGLSKNASKHHIYDSALEQKMNRATFLALALALKTYIQKNFKDEKRIGIALPSGIAGAAVNIAVQMASKVSVNVNFTMGRTAAEASLKRAGVNIIISAEKLREKVAQKIPDFPWPEKFYDISKILKEIGKPRIAKNILAIKLLPACALIKLFSIPTQGGEKEASIIFTSGSEGEPKAAVLTHRNLMANCLQMYYTDIIPDTEILHANLPLFHSFGQSIQVWFTSVFPHQVVTVANPLEVKLNLEAMHKGKSTLMISTPTFLRAYLKKGDPEMVKSLNIVIAGAEKTPEGFKEAWEAKFPNCAYKVGYGLTEASPVVSVNLPDRCVKNEYRDYQGGTRSGSVGQLFAGMQAAIMHPETCEFLPIGASGILCLKGGNIFQGYLDAPELNAEKFKDGWLLTGDIAMLDEDGYIFIKGRVSRFSKIGGEMVPHMSVEEAIVDILDQRDSDVETVVISSRDNADKGEELVLITTLEVDMQDLRKKLSAKGVSNLWIPKICVKVGEIPTLATGKLSLGEIKKIAQNAQH